MSWERNLIRLYMRSLDEQTEWVFKIQTTLLMVASTTFAVIISLSSPSEDSLCNKVLLVTAICVNALCILFSGISLCENRVLSNQAVRTYQEYLRKYHNGELPHGQAYVYESIPKRKIFVFCEGCSYVSFLLFIIVLVAYTIVRSKGGKTKRINMWLA